LAPLATPMLTNHFVCFCVISSRVEVTLAIVGQHYAPELSVPGKVEGGVSRIDQEVSRVPSPVNLILK